MLRIFYVKPTKRVYIFPPSIRAALIQGDVATLVRSHMSARYSRREQYNKQVAPEHVAQANMHGTFVLLLKQVSALSWGCLC